MQTSSLKDYEVAVTIRSAEMEQANRSLAQFRNRNKKHTASFLKPSYIPELFKEIEGMNHGIALISLCLIRETIAYTLTNG